jgi:prephenate dehydratase
MFFVDLDGRRADPGVQAAIAGLRARAGELHTLGSFPVAETTREAGSVSN